LAVPFLHPSFRSNASSFWPSSLALTPPSVLPLFRCFSLMAVQFFPPFQCF
jgi:hypothetical protein